MQCSTFRPGEVLPLVVLGLCLISPPAPAELGDVLHTIPCAGANTADIAWVEGTLYQVIFSPTEERNIYQLDPLNGSVMAILPYAGGSPQGLAYDGYNLWQGDLADRQIFKLDPLTGAIRGQFTAPGPANCQPLGLGWDGISLWVADSRGPETIWQVDTLGTVLSSFPAPGTSPYGLAWGGGFIWVSNNAVGGTAQIYKMDPLDGAVLASFACPDGGGSPNGIAHDGQNLWIAVNTTDLIYKVDDGLGGAGVTEEVRPPPGISLDGAMARVGQSTVVVRFSLASSCQVRLDLLDPLGRRVQPAAEAWYAAGTHRAQLAASELASGAYYIRLIALGSSATGRVIYLD